MALETIFFSSFFSMPYADGAELSEARAAADEARAAHEAHLSDAGRTPPAQQEHSRCFWRELLGLSFFSTRLFRGARAAQG
jgi:hypothetical protein